MKQYLHCIVAGSLLLALSAGHPAWAQKRGGILRLSTFVLAFAGCSAIYLTLLELEIDPRVSLIAALTVALSPVYFALSFTFMTDVPFVALCAVALFCYVSALVRGEPRRLWWGGAAAMLAFFIRPIGVVLK